ncbi:hypothetical protein H839_13384 [Parageobacillus genomosp. 1]|uniref:TetR family transcriptional regulator n=1 Tax=Parageobacillus genomosp. 1 TaxID=1295642 RepID=A0ABC9VD38_9BACL|nr:hypothetical protein H839_13384 [Parageobacillus genomosp. 1]
MRYATSMQEIAEQSGMAKGSVYNWRRARPFMVNALLLYEK